MSEKFLERVDRRGPDECWPWLGAKTPKGYGYLGKVPAHRIAYELAYGPIPEGLEIDHVRARGCTRRDCVNPAHLEAVSHRENLLRGDTFAGRRAVQTHCVNGHEFTEANTYRRADRDTRECRTCRNRSAAASHQKAKA